MSLQTNVTARYSDQRLRELTNPDARAATSVDSTRLGLACTDAAAEFARRTATTYDDTDADHVDVAVELVIQKLMERSSLPAAATQSQRSKVDEQFRLLAATTGHDRPTASTTGDLVTVDRPGADGATVRKKFDPKNLRGWLPRSPTGA